jgi:hypothetical protein
LAAHRWSLTNVEAFARGFHVRPTREPVICHLKEAAMRGVKRFATVAHFAAREECHSAAQTQACSAKKAE